MCFPFAVTDFLIDSYIDLSGKSAENFQKQKCTKNRAKSKENNKKIKRNKQK